MARISFTAHCARNHVRIDFTDPAAFEAHMRGEHKARKPWPGMAVPTSSVGYHGPVAAPGMRGGRILPPHDWKAPARAPGGIDRVAERIAAGEYAWDYVRGGRRVTMGPAGEVVAA